MAAILQDASSTTTRLFQQALIADLRANISSTDVCSPNAMNTALCGVWDAFSYVLLIQGKTHQALEVSDALYGLMLTHQANTKTRVHKGLPLFRISQCHQALGNIVHAKRYMMLTLCEDGVSHEGALKLNDTGSYGQLAWHYGLSDQQIHGYAEQAHIAYRSNPSEASMPEWIMQRLDQLWKTEIPSAAEAGTFHVSRNYCEFLLARLGTGGGHPLEHLAEYLVSAMPGCRTYVRARTFSSDHDIVASVEGPIADFRSELGRYFVCECKDKQNKRASFSDVAKFCRVLDSVKAKFGIIFSTHGHSGEGKTVNADREIMKVYQDRGIVIVVVELEDLRRVASGANFISMLRQKYEIVRLDLRPRRPRP